MRGLLAVAAAFAVLLSAAAIPWARPVKTGESTRMLRDPLPTMAHVYFANQIDTEVTVLAFPGHTRPGDRYDLIDEQGYIGRVVVKSVEETACADTKYEQAIGTFVGGRPKRDATGMMIALGPVLPSPGRARILSGDVTARSLPPKGKASLQPAIDLDGDGVPDLARYVIYNCHTNRTKNPEGDTCIETWGRDGGAWHLIERAEFPPCT